MPERCVSVYTMNIMDRKILVLPKKFENILKRNQELSADVLGTVNVFAEVLRKNELYFFEEYTDHGIGHIESVLECACRIIDDKAMKELIPEDVAVLVLAVVLHDIGMHVGFASFKRMLEGGYDGIRMKELDKKTWKELWEEFLVDCKYFSGYQREMIWGDPHYDAGEPDLTDAGKLTGNDRKLIGEFIRRHHPRIAHEIAVAGFWGNELVAFGQGSVGEDMKKIAGIVARSHGIAVRDTFGYLKGHYSGLEWKNPRGIHVVFLMAVLRVADYLQMDKSRASQVALRLKMFGSPYSLKEHQAHLAVERVNFECEDPECILVNCKPEDSQMYVKLKRLVDDIQYELDMSWAVLGEVYGGKNKLGLKYRRICSDITEEAQMERLKYVPQKISFRFNDELSKLLIAPLYGNHPTFGVRELVQNATDACLERDKLEELAGNKGYDPRVKVSIDRNEEGIPVFSIVDNGKGMTIKEIVDYFLTIGSSFRASKEWKKLSDEYRVYRNGRFGIGVLAAFLIGERISVRTRSVKDECGYCFSAGLDDEFIEVKKDDSIQEAGTEIWIESSEEKVGLLDGVARHSRGGVKQRPIWYMWYIDKRPRVEYFRFGKFQKGMDFFQEKELRELSHTCQGFGKIFWLPVNMFYVPDKTRLACNGIIITDHSCNDKFKGVYLPYFNFTVKYLPDLHVNDLYNSIPLKLDRMDVDRDDYEYPFEKDLFKEVVKDFIAQLLALDLAEYNLLRFNRNATFWRRTVSVDECLYFVCGEAGYTLSFDFFLHALKKKYSKLFVFDLADNMWNENISMKSFFRGSHEPLLFISRCRTYGENNSSKNLYQNKFGVMCACLKGTDFNGERERGIEKFVNLSCPGTKVTKEQNLCYEYLFFGNPEYADSFVEAWDFVNVFLSKFSKKERKNGFSIVEYDLKQIHTEKFGGILDDLLRRYFGEEDVMIPYDLEDRKKKFPLAFEELGDYMKDYIGRGHRRGV